MCTRVQAPGPGGGWCLRVRPLTRTDSAEHASQHPTREETPELPRMAWLSEAGALTACPEGQGGPGEAQRGWEGTRCHQ